MTSQNGGSSSAAPAAAPVKRSLFKKSAHAKQNRTEGEDALELFSRREQVFSNVIAERERERIKRLAKLEKKKSETKIAIVDSEDGGGKRRRLSTELEELSDDEKPSPTQKRRSSSSTTTPQSRNGRSVSVSEKTNPELSPTNKPLSRRTRNSKAATSKPTIISLDDSDDSDAPLPKPNKYPALYSDDDNDDENLYSTSKNKREAPKQPEVSIMDDEEELFPELVAKAREDQRKIMAQHLSRVKSNYASSVSVSTDSDGVKSELGIALRSPAISTPDPVLKICVSSRIEGTNPLILKRKLSQRLKDVRLAWCDRQRILGEPMSQSSKDKIFLTWRRHKLFDVSTCASLGLKFTSDGQPQVEGDDGFDNGNIHLEAWTDEFFQEHKREIEQQRRLAVADPLEEEEEEEREPISQPQVEKAPHLRIILMAREYDQYKLKVTATTTWLKVITAFRRGRNIPDEKTVSLRLDGDELEPTSTVDEADLDDMTTIDVHVS